MTEVTHQINLALRTAAGHARAAKETIDAADKAYEMKMKSAGASVWEAWTLAVRAQPEYANRKLDDRALARIYESTKARPWWDRHLSTVKVEGKPANREWAKRTIQWHTDPDAAKARRAKESAQNAVSYQRRKERVAAQGRESRPQAEGREPTTAEMREIQKATAHAQGWPAAVAQKSESGDWPQAGSEISQLLERVRRAAQRVTGEYQLAEAEALLRITAEGLEAL